GANDSAVADSLDYLAVPFIRLQRFADARRRLDRSRQIRESRADQEPLPLARMLELCALLERYMGNYGEALSYVERGLETQRRLTPDHPEMVIPLNTKADIQYLRGDTKGAQRTWTEALGLGQRTLRPSHPYIGLLLLRLANAADYFGNVTQAHAFAD